MTQLQAFLAGPGGVALVAALAVLTVLFLLLWLRAKGGGQEPPELVEFRRRALEAEGRLQTEVATLTERHKKEVQILEAALGKSSVTGTIIAPSSAAVRDRMDRMEKDLAEAQSRLEAA